MCATNKLLFYDNVGYKGIVAVFQRTKARWALCYALRLHFLRESSQLGHSYSHGMDRETEVQRSEVISQVQQASK